MTSCCRCPAYSVKQQQQRDQRQTASPQVVKGLVVKATRKGSCLPTLRMLIENLLTLMREREFVSSSVALHTTVSSCPITSTDSLTPA